MYSGTRNGLGAFFVNGQEVPKLYVGQTMVFDLPGLPRRVWVEQEQNGRQQYSGPYDLPAAAYTLQAQDAGSFKGAAYDLTPDGKRGGGVLAVWTMTVDAGQPPTISTRQDSTTGTVVNVLSKPAASGFNPSPVIISAPPYSSNGVEVQVPEPSTSGLEEYIPYVAIGGLALVLLFGGKRGR